MKQKNLKTRENIFLIFCFLIGVIIFSYYIYRIIFPSCSILGYTLCALIGEDFFALFQAGHNILNANFIYGPSAENNLITPFFMTFKYFPVSAIFLGVPFVIIAPTAEFAFSLFLALSIAIHFLGIFFIWLICKKQKVGKYILGVSLLIFLSAFPLNSEWRMGQFNDIAGVFFLGFLTAVIYDRKFLSSVFWMLSFFWKPIIFLSFPFFIKARDKLGTFLILAFVFLGTVIYIGFFQIFDNKAITYFLNTLFLYKDRVGWSLHHIDNFSVYSFLGELLYDHFYNIYFISTSIYLFLIIFIYLIITFKIKLKSKINKIYYLLFSVSTLLVYSREIWESTLSFWTLIVIAAFLFAKNKERIIIGFCGLIFVTPSLFYFWHFNETEFWRFLLIGEKALPQIVMYTYFLYKILNLMLIDRKNPSS